MNPPMGAFFRAVPNGIVGPEIIGVPGPKFFPTNHRCLRNGSFHHFALLGRGFLELGHARAVPGPARRRGFGGPAELGEAGGRRARAAYAGGQARAKLVHAPACCVGNLRRLWHVPHSAKKITNNKFDS